MFLDELFYALGQAYGLTCAAIYDTGNFALHNDGTDYFRQLVHGNKVVFVFSRSEWKCFSSFFGREE